MQIYQISILHKNLFAATSRLTLMETNWIVCTKSICIACNMQMAIV